LIHNVTLLRKKSVQKILNVNKVIFIVRIVISRYLDMNQIGKSCEKIYFSESNSIYWSSITI